MKTILDLETELGTCLGTGAETFAGRRRLHPAPWTVWIHTQAIVHGHGSQRVLRTQHRCFLRCNGDVNDQDWIHSRLTFEPLDRSESEIMQPALQAHERFVNEAMESIPGLELKRGCEPACAPV